MKYLLSLVPLLGCGGTSKPATTHDKIGEMRELGALMKNDINPAFSKLTMLVFHGESMQEDPKVVKTELTTAATVLKGAIAKLREYRNPPTATSQGRDVFFTYAGSVDRATQKLFAAIERSDSQAAATELEGIAQTCNNCHHFFRLDIEDSVVPAAGRAKKKRTELSFAD